MAKIPWPVSTVYWDKYREGTPTGNAFAVSVLLSLDSFIALRKKMRWVDLLLFDVIDDNDSSKEIDHEDAFEIIHVQLPYMLLEEWSLGREVKTYAHASGRLPL